MRSHFSKEMIKMKFWSNFNKTEENDVLGSISDPILRPIPLAILGPAPMSVSASIFSSFFNFF